MITGGTSGIGFAIAERFLQEGASRVILVGRSYERLHNAASRLQIDSPETAPKEPTQPIANPEQHQLLESSSRISLLVGDIAEAGSWARELEKAMQTTNPDILVNAAGLSISSILPKSEPTDISRILRTNLEGALLTSRAFIRASIRNRMKRSSTATNGNNSGSNSTASSKCIINISSLLAHKSGTGAVPYAASKAGILGLTRSVAVEAAASLRDVVVRSNAIVPGYIETPMISDFSEGETARLKESIPVRRFGRPDEVADAAVFLAQNEYANNCVLNLDGGLSAV
ncbi:reductase [Aspergillus brasiliensis]|uniref:Reductase n=1 Tax=Aspergillus brasiliensis TaxID=319629 RepID=A0A9W5YUJ9_9EURO|nr:reductase [Aspergillus brasiliensis]GKZ46003.1 reductase [Aspergillus brasiliensis]